jgi:hypothetical protein
MERNGGATARFAEREVQGLGDDGSGELITIWIERRPGAVWTVGRAVALAERPDGAVRPDDFIFEGYEMGDALEAANSALDGDLAASADNDDHNRDVLPFAEAELQKKLERWFFDHA